MSETLNKGQIRAQVETYLMNTSTDVNSLSWSPTELDSYINEATFYTQQITQYYEEFSNIICTASVSTYTGPANAYQYERFTWDRDFLPQTNEYELDRDDPSWRSASPNNPFRFYFPQMAQQYQIVPYPTPSQDGISFIASQEFGAVAAFNTGGMNTLASDPFTQANGPLNPAKWTGDSSLTYSALKVLNNQCVPQVGNNLDNGSAMVYTGIVWPNNQWAQFTVGNLGSVTQPWENDFQLVLRSNSDLSNCYAMEMDMNSPVGAATSEITLNIYFGDNVTPFSTPIDLVNLVINSGDVFLFTVVGNVLSMYQNGNLVAPPFVDNRIASGSAGIFENTFLGAAQASAVINFTGGGFSSADSNYQFIQETGIVIGFADTNGSLIGFRPDVVANPFTLISGELGELQVYSTDELNLGVCFTRIPDTMVLDTDTPQLPPNTHFALVLYALMKCFVREGEFQDLQEATEWFTAYGDWMESVLENKARRWPTRVKSLEPFEEGSLFAKRLQAVGYPMQLDLKPSYGA